MPRFKITEKLRTPDQTNRVEINTYGDLKTIIAKAFQKQLGGIVKTAASDTVPFGGTIKHTFDVLASYYKGSDNTKTGTFLDKLNVDDEFSKIVDDKVEISFLYYLADKINKKPDNEKIPSDWNINRELQKFLSSKYNSRTVTIYGQRQ